jgi:hypothetical protein
MDLVVERLQAVQQNTELGRPQGNAMNDFEDALKALPEAVAEMRVLHTRVDFERGFIEVSAAEVAAKPYLVWNGFVAVIGGSTLPYERMTELQRLAHLAFLYDGEVQNGGHLQFFLNTQDLGRDFVHALERMLLPAHAELLRRAYDRWRARPRSEPENAEEFVELARKEEFADVDTAYHQLSPTITDGLERLLKEHRDEFVRVMS